MGPDAFEPWATVFGEEVRRAKPDFAVATRPWERLTKIDGLRQLFLDSGIALPLIAAIEDRQPLADPTDWWTIAMGSGFRWEIDQLTTDETQAVKSRCLERLSHGDNTMCTNANFAIAVKPRPGGWHTLSPAIFGTA